MLRYGLLDPVSSDQSGPQSALGSAGPPALTRYRMEGSTPGHAPLGSEYSSPGSVAGVFCTTGDPPASGKNASRGWYSCPIVFVSSPTHSPSGVEIMMNTPSPGDRLGFQASGIPLIGSSAAIARRLIVPGPTWSPR